MKYLKNILILTTGCIVNHALIAVPFKGITAASPESLSFIENKGQITDQNYSARSDIQFKLSAGNGLNIFIGASAVHYQFSAQTAPAHFKEPKKLVISRKHNQSPPDDEEPHISSIYRMDVELVGANRNASFITQQVQDYYENTI